MFVTQTGFYSVNNPPPLYFLILDMKTFYFILQIHDSNQGQAFRSQVQSMHMDILQSPWLCELIALHINLRETKGIMGNDSELFEGCFLIFNDGKPSLSCELSDAFKLEIDLTCSICLVSSSYISFYLTLLFSRKNHHY